MAVEQAGISLVSARRFPSQVRAGAPDNLPSTVADSPVPASNLHLRDASKRTVTWNINYEQADGQGTVRKRLTGPLKSTDKIRPMFEYSKGGQAVLI